MPLDPSYGNAIAGIESGGRYGILGPLTKNGDRAYGKYQVMGNNIGPWTEQHYGQRLSPQEYLANKDAQEAVFQGEFGKYVQKYGPEGAAKAWFAGERGMNNPNATDVLGTSVQGYGQKFMAGLGQQPPAQAAQPAAPDMADWYQPQVGQPMGILPPAAQRPGPPLNILPPVAQSEPAALGSFTPSQTQNGGLLGNFNQQPPPDLVDLASLLKQQAPKRGLLRLRG